MDKSILSVARIVGSVSSSAWSQVSVHPQGKIKVGEERESMFLALAVVGVELDETAEVGKGLIERIRSEFFEFGEGELEKRLLSSVENALVDLGEEDISLVVGAIKADQLAFVSLGGGGALMLRDGSLGWVTQKSLEAEPVVGLGSWKQGDLMVAGTKQFFGALDSNQLTEVISRSGASEVGEHLASKIHGKGVSDGVAALVIEVVETDIEEVEENEKLEKFGPRGVSKWSRALDRLPQKRLVGKLRGRYRSLVGKVRRGGRTANPEVYLQSRSKKKVTVSVALMLLLLLGVSVGLGWRKRLADDTSERYLAVYEPAKVKFDDALGLVETNPLRARTLLTEVQADVEGKLDDFNEGSNERGKLTELLTEVKEKYLEIAGEKMIDEASLFFDLTLVRDDLFGDKIEFEDGKLAVLDTSHRVVAEIEADNKQASVAGGGDLFSGARLLGATVGRAVVLTEKGVISVWYGDREPEILIEPEEDWGRLVAIGTYGGNIYLVDADTSELWRYPGIEGGVGARRRWLGPGVIPDFSETIDVAIDGDLWLLDSDGKVSHYRQGAPVSFEIVGLVDEIREGVAIDTAIESEAIYILDRGNNRVLVVGKDGQYREQYMWTGISGVSDMAIVEELGKILLLSGSSIYEIETKVEANE